jgi:hypothetical protein
MRQTPRPKKRTSARRNPFDCPGWGVFVLRSVQADQMAAAAAARRVTKSGATLH